MQHLLTTAAIIGSKVVAAVSTTLAVGMVLYSGLVLYDTVYTDRTAFLSTDLEQYRPGMTEEEPDFAEMQKINPDTCAWVTMLGTNIDYPVVQGKNDVEYAMKDIYGKSSLTGAIYLTTMNNNEFTDSFNLIYGHHMDNGAMFGDIEKYQDMDYFYSHQDGILITTRGVYDIHILGRLSADAYDSKVYEAGDRPASAFPDYLYYLKSLSVQWDPSTDIEAITANIQKYITARDKNIAENGRFVFKKMPEDAVLNGMQLIAFSTCADATTNGRELLVGTMKFRTEPLPPELLEDEETPLAAWGHGEATHWALLNAICVILMLVVLLPGSYLRRKRETVLHAMKTKNGSGVQQLVGIALEAVLAVFGIVWFFLTESITRPMMIVDRWTFGMIALFAIMLATDVWLVRYNENIETGKGKT